MTAGTSPEPAEAARPANAPQALADTRRRRTIHKETLATVTVTTSDGPVVVACEPVGEWLAITPTFGMNTLGGTYLGGDFTITHIPTGLRLAEGSSCIECCRHAGRLLAGLAVDWATLTANNASQWANALDADARQALAAARAVGWACDTWPGRGCGPVADGTAGPAGGA
jgi:hypothetical protein